MVCDGPTEPAQTDAYGLCSLRHREATRPRPARPPLRVTRRGVHRFTVAGTQVFRAVLPRWWRGWSVAHPFERRTSSLAYQTATSSSKWSHVTYVTLSRSRLI
ncbi:hypothetical protein FRAHR75_380066 [Frankia sp. Hr75.2]|nr:hypothetical protein FRAHR75_380066 [Frankia sp. Hr75.2]